MEIEKSSAIIINNKEKEASPLKAELSVFIQSCIDNIIIKEGFLNHNLKIKNIPTDGGSYLASLYEVDIRGKTKLGEKEVNLFIKKTIPINNKSFSGIFRSISDLYLNECYVYKDLSKIFRKLEDEASVPLEERYKIAKCYEESSTEAIILDNLSRKGFKTCDRNKPVPLKFMELTVQQLAKFNSFGFIIKKLMPDYFERQISTLDEVIVLGDCWINIMKKNAEGAMKKMNSDARQKAEVFVENVQDFTKYRSDKTSIQTLCHGDFRANNILMKEKDGEVVDVIPIDYQIIHYGCPVNDFLYFIYGCTDPQFRRRHMSHLIDMYYDTMSNYLKYFNIDIAEVYPRKEFESDLRNRPNFGVLIALGFYAVFYASGDNAPDLSNENDEPLEVDVDFDIVKRIEDTIYEIDKQCFL